MRKNQKGFTLAELLVVIAITSILAAISFPYIGSFEEVSNERQDIQHMRNAESASIQYYFNHYYETGNYIYDVDTNSLIPSGSDQAKSIQKYGLGTEKTTTDATKDLYMGYTSNLNVKNKVLLVTIHNDKDIDLKWIDLANRPASDISKNSDAVRTPAPTSSPDTSKLIGVTPTNWSTLVKDAHWGVSIPVGTLVTDGNDEYVFYSYKTYYSGDLRNTKIAEVYQSDNFKNCVEKISITTIYKEDDFLTTFNGKSIPVGTLFQLNSGDYVILAQSYIGNKYNMPSVGQNNWIKIK